MAKTLTFEFEGQAYTLEYTRRTVSEMERDGFIAADIDRMPMTLLPKLFGGAFLAHHRFVKKEVIQKIYDSMRDKTELIGKLAEMYNEPLNALVADPEESEGNVVWTANW